MKKDRVSEMRTLKGYLQKSGKKITNIRYIGNIELIELINKEPHLLEKDIYVCDEKIVDENGQEIDIIEYYTQDFESLAREDERYDSMILNEKYSKHPEVFDKLKELDEKGLIDLNRENIEEVAKVAEYLNIDKESVENMSEIDLQRINDSSKSQKLEANAKLTINANEKITTRDTMEAMLGVEGKGYKKIIVIDSKELQNSKSSAPFAIVGINDKNQMEEIDSLEQVYGTNPTRNINSISADGDEIEDEQSSSMYKIKGREDEQLSIGFGEYNTMKISLVRTSPETNESISIPIETNTIVHTEYEQKEFMDSSKNPKTTAETKRIEEHKEHGCDPITKEDIDDDPTNNTHEHYDDEYIPNTTIKWQDFANSCGYRGSGSIELAKEKFEEEKEKNPELENEQIVQNTIEEQEEDFDFSTRPR